MKSKITEPATKGDLGPKLSYTLPAIAIPKTPPRLWRPWRLLKIDPCLSISNFFDISALKVGVINPAPIAKNETAE